MVRLGEVSPSIWDAVTEQMEMALADIEFQATDILLDWRDDASKRRLDRELHDKYGILKDVILHPAYQYSVVWIEENVRYDVLLGEPLIPMATAVIVLYMLHKRVSDSILVLIGAFLFNLNPLYVTILLICYHFYSKKSPKHHIKSIISPSNDWMSYTAEVTASNESNNEYDHVLIGNDISTLYTAALLSKNGHKCCVIQSVDGIQPEVDLTHAGFNCRPIPLQDLSISKPDKYKLFFNIITPSNNCDSGAFAPIGAESTGYTHAIIKFKDITSSSGSNGNIIPLRTKLQSLVNDLSSASIIDDKDKVSILALFEELINKNAQYIYKSSIDKVGSPPNKTDDDIKVETIDSIIDSTLSKYKNNSILKDCLCAIAAYAANESVCSHDCSIYNLTAGLSRINDGVFYPVGGYRSIETYLTKCIRHTGGAIYKKKKINQIIIEDNRAIGVEINNAVRITSTKSVVSGLGLLHTYCNLVGSVPIPEEIAACEEARPKIYVIFGLIGTSGELGLTACDYMEGDSSPEKHCKVWSPSCKDPSWSSESPNFQIVVVEFEAIEPIVEANSNAPKMYKLKGTKGSRLDESREKQIIEKARNKVTELYPKCKGKDSNIHVYGPVVGGHILSSKYTKFSNYVTAKSSIDGLFFTGCDLSTTGLSGDLESAFNTCNSILDYNATDLTVADFSSKANVVRRTVLTDLANL